MSSSVFRDDLFQDARVLVTGGTGGIGRAVAAAFADHGARVTVTGRTDEECSTAAGSDSRLETCQLDVTDTQSIDHLVDRIDDLQVLVNAAGCIARDGRELEIEGFLHTVDVNLQGTARVCYACRPRLSPGSSVLNVASMLSYFGSGFVPGYSASKGGLVQLTKSLAIAWAEAGIRVNAVAPGWIKTPLTEPLSSDPDRSRQITARTPLGRWGRPADLTGTALFLCSPAADFITGSVLPVDGGYSAC